MHKFGFIRVAAASPKLKVGDPEYNIIHIEKLIRDADNNSASIIVFPELCITGYTCADLFGQKLLIDKALLYLSSLLEKTIDTSVLAVVGLPVMIEHKLYNCAAVIQSGKILGIVPKMHIPNYKEFYEKRWFTSGTFRKNEVSDISILNTTVPFGPLIFKCMNIKNLNFGVEICEDLWTVIPPSSFMSLQGATVIGNPSASNEVVSKGDYRHNLISQQSGRCISAYIYSSCGVHESTTDIVFGGDMVIAENGSIISKSERFKRDNNIIYSEVDIERLSLERQINKSFDDNLKTYNQDISYRYIEYEYPDYAFNNNSSSSEDFNRFVNPLPFVPGNPSTRNAHCEEVFSIQVAGLAKRLEHTGITNSIIGISGGLDSTLALLVTAKAYDLLGLDRRNIQAITMPGFGTTSRTLNNAINLCSSLKTSLKEINIVPACLRHFEDIGHDINIHDVTYENVQARERTQILMDTANKMNGLVIGTGDLSELALGWCTYNGDHMSMYAVNCSVPKTLVKSLVSYVADTQMDGSSKDILIDIINTPISPELLPPDKSGNIVQKTEDTVGPYELHDFFLYHMIKYGAPPKKILFLASKAFKDKYGTEYIKKWLKSFYRRFFTQQFKRSCIPDGPKVGTISLSPRGDWRMPSDASYNLWVKELDQND